MAAGMAADGIRGGAAGGPAAAAASAGDGGPAAAAASAGGGGPAAAAPARAVLLDALGTLLELVPPWPALVRELGVRGVAVGEAQARSALLAEMAYYRAHLDEAADAAGLARLRRRCAAVLADALPPAARALGRDALLDALLASLVFRPYPEVPGALRALRAAGARLVVVSNWDVSLHEVLARTGLAPLVDGVVTSAELGAAKPDPRIFARALAVAGDVPPAAALHAGDSPDADVAGAQAAGIAAVLVTRHGERPPPGVPSIATLDGLLGAWPPGRPSGAPPAGL
jgi:putative hydrolase of the HAD superfamily